MPKIAGFVLIFVLCITAAFAQNQKLTAEKVVAEHIRSIGSPEAMAGTKSRAFVGSASVNFIQGGHGTMAGTSMFVSDGNKLAAALKFADINYPGEYLAFNGESVSVGYISPGQRSPMADFLFRYNGLIKEGLMGGVLSCGWPLLRLQESDVELEYGKTKVEGRQLYEIKYRPRKSLRDTKVTMYFDPETFHHVRTEYRVRVRDDMSAAPGGGQTGFGKFSAPTGQEGGFSTLHQGLPDSIYTLIEKFDDFRKVGAAILPHSYAIYYSAEGQGGSFIAEWTMKADQWLFNQAYEDKIFNAQK